MRPNFDTATSYSYSWCQDIVDYLKGNNAIFLDLKDADAVRDKVEEALQQHPDAMLVHYDHGDTTEILGDNAEPVIDLTNVQLLGGHECYNMNCLSGKVLGAVAHNEYDCPAYWGYVETVIFSTDALEEFKTALNYGFYKRFEGLSWEECVSKTKKVMQQFANQLASEGKIIASVAMTNNMNALVCYNGGGEQPNVCPFRRLAHKLLPQKYKRYAWKISRKSALAMILQPLGIGLSVHDFIAECGQIANPYRMPPHGFWWGILFILVGLFLWTWEIVNWINLKKRAY